MHTSSTATSWRGSPSRAGGRAACGRCGVTDVFLRRTAVRAATRILSEISAAFFAPVQLLGVGVPCGVEIAARILQVFLEAVPTGFVVTSSTAFKNAFNSCRRDAMRAGLEHAGGGRDLSGLLPAFDVCYGRRGRKPPPRREGGAGGEQGGATDLRGEGGRHAGVRARWRASRSTPPSTPP